MRVVPVHAFGISATLRPKEVAALFDLEKCGAQRLTKTLALAEGPDGRFIVVHDFGAVVFFDWSKADREAFLTKLLATLPPEPHPPLLDDYLLEVRDDVEPKVGFDRTVVPVLNASTAEIVSLVLAQSVAMDYYEEDVRAAYGRVDQFASQLATKGKIALSEKQLNAFVGNVLATRNQIAMTLSLLDAPDLTWEREDFDRLYRALRHAFEIEDRYQTVQHKIELIQENLAIVVDLGQHRRARALEWIVIVLIAAEIFITIAEVIWMRRR
ncbi:MAG: RMD1 family protein [Polyangiales bacterium]